MAKLLQRRIVLNIRSQHRAGYTIKEIAAAYGLNRDTVSNIVRNLTYKHVQDVPHAPLPTDEAQRRRDIDAVARARRR